MGNQMVTDQLFAPGQISGNFRIESLIAAGPFSDVFLATTCDTGRKSVIKASNIGQQPRSITSCPTEALFFMTGGIGLAMPDPVELLDLQFQTLCQLSGCEGFPQVEPLVAGKRMFAYAMRFIPGTTLREALLVHKTGLGHFLSILKAVDHMQQRSILHCDLKPENIMVNGDDICIIDPGYIGPLNTDAGRQNPCVVSTPAYYPLLEPDDMLALGIILWELATGSHPLQPARGENSDNTTAGDNLFNLVHYKQLVGQHYLTPLLTLQCPDRRQPGFEGVPADVLYKALKLNHQAGVLHLDPGFKNAGELASTLR